jgi:hypothetical protein
MSSDSRRIKWIAKGKIYKVLGTPGVEKAVDADINIQESDAIKMPDGRKIFGEPVNARLAIFYIRKLWKEIERNRLLSIYDDTHAFFELLRKEFKGSEGLDREEFLRKLREFNDRWKDANNWLIELLRNSFGITMDKGILLKTLSQPDCEGIRNYLAMKKKREEKGSKNGEVEDSEGFPVILTLVTVGVDKQGTDLHYEYEDDKHTVDSIPDIENESLSFEYPGTSGIPPGEHKLKLPALQPYVLYKYAIHKKDAEK